MFLEKERLLNKIWWQRFWENLHVIELPKTIQWEVSQISLEFLKQHTT